jgi:hypothetical protein
MEDFGIFVGHLNLFYDPMVFYGHLVHFVAIWYIFPSFGTSYREKSGNPGKSCDFEPTIRAIYFIVMFLIIFAFWHSKARPLDSWHQSDSIWKDEETNLIKFSTFFYRDRRICSLFFSYRMQDNEY